MELRTWTLSGRSRTGYHRRFVALVLAVMLLATLAAPLGAASNNFPESIPLPVGFQPEGITIGYGHTFYVGSIPTGNVYSGDLRTGEGKILVQALAGRSAVGMKVDERSGYLFVAGGQTGHAYVYSAKTGTPVADYLLTTTPGTFINDVFVTHDAAYFTNSSEAALYRLPLGPAGRLPSASDVQRIPLTGQWEQVAGLNANGIVSTPGDKWLILVNTTTGKAFRVDPRTGDATLIDFGGQTLVRADGLWLQGHTLWVVQNTLNQVSVVKMNSDFTAGSVVDTITGTAFKVPTTIAPFGKWFYAVNAQFGVANPDATQYDIVRFERK